MPDTPPTPQPERRTELAASLHDIADKIAQYEGELPATVHLNLLFSSFDGRYVEAVDQLAAALFGRTGQPKKSTPNSWEHSAEGHLPGGLTTSIYTYIPAPAEEDPAALRARIAELEAEVQGRRAAEGGEQS